MSPEEGSPQEIKQGENWKEFRDVFSSLPDGIVVDPNPDYIPSQIDFSDIFEENREQAREMASMISRYLSYPIMIDSMSHDERNQWREQTRARIEMEEGPYKAAKYYTATRENRIKLNANQELMNSVYELAEASKREDVLNDYNKIAELVMSYAEFVREFGDEAESNSQKRVMVEEISQVASELLYKFSPKEE